MSNIWASPAETPRPTGGGPEDDDLFGALGGAGDAVGAGFGIRALARILDVVFAALVSASAGAATSVAVAVGVEAGLVQEEVLYRLGQEMSMGALVFATVFGILPAVVSQALAGVTPGKLVCGLRVVRATGVGPISFGQSLGRELAYFIDALFFAAPAYFSMSESPRAQRLGDKWAGTMVRFRRDLDPDRYSNSAALMAIVAAVVVAIPIDVIGLFL